MVFLLLGYTLIATAQTLSFGRYAPVPLTLVACGVAIGVVAACTRGRDKGVPPRALLAAMALAVVATGLAKVPFTYAEDVRWIVRYRQGLMLGAVLIATYFLPRGGPRWLRRPRLLLLMAVVVWFRLAVPLVSPRPGEDVWFVQQEAAAAVLSGQDPYGISYTQIFAPEFYEVLGYQSGFHYPPLTILAIVPSYLLLGDVRWSYVLIELALVLFLWVSASRSRRVGGWANAELVVWMWGLNSSVLFVLEHAWTEPLGLVCVAGFLALDERGRRWPAAVSLAAFFSYKQYAMLLFPLLWFLPVGGRVFLAFVGLSLASYGPWLVAGAGGLISSMMEPWKAPPRADALSLSAMWIRQRMAYAPDWLNPLFLLAGVHLSLTRIGRDRRGMILALFTATALLFVSAKQSFCNYYYLVSYLVLVAAVIDNTSRAGDVPPTAGTSGSSTVVSGDS